MNRLVAILIAAVVLYLLFRVFMKVTQWIFRIIILGIVVSLFVVGALNFDALFSGSPQKILENIKTAQPESSGSAEPSVVPPSSVGIELADNSSLLNASQETQQGLQEVNGMHLENKSALQ